LPIVTVSAKGTQIVADLKIASAYKITYIDFYIKEVSMELFGILGIVAVWYILNRWILPRLGVQT
jgi:hypothetical protein